MGWNEQVIANLRAAALALGQDLDDMPSDWNGQVVFLLGLVGAGIGAEMDLVWRGAWSGATGYVAKDVVQSAGSTYVAVDANTNSLPPSAHWELLTAKGATGAAGAAGAQGPAGTQGMQGEQGPTGEVSADALYTSLRNWTRVAAVNDILADPPAVPTEGDRYIVIGPASGAWIGHVGSIATWHEAAWVFTAPAAGLVAFDGDSEADYVCSGTAWTAAAPFLVSGLFRVGTAIQADLGGNARGAGAIDLQTDRLNATEVASGTQSVILGGFRNTASGAQAVVLGGAINTATATYSSAQGIGTLVSGVAAHAEGNGTTASGDHSHAEGGTTVASAIASHAEGVFTQATAAGSHAGGQYSVARLAGQQAFAGGMFYAYGDAQATRFVLRGATADDTPTVLASPEAFVIPDETTMSLLVHLVARQDTGAAVGSGIYRVLIDRTGGTVTISDQTPIGSGGAIAATTWAVAITADDIGKSLVITVTGVAATNIRWVALIEAVEVQYADVV